MFAGINKILLRSLIVLCQSLAVHSVVKCEQTGYRFRNKQPVSVEVAQFTFTFSLIKSIPLLATKLR